MSHKNVLFSYIFLNSYATLNICIYSWYWVKACAKHYHSTTRYAKCSFQNWRYFKMALWQRRCFIAAKQSRILCTACSLLLPVPLWKCDTTQQHSKGHSHTSSAYLFCQPKRNHSKRQKLLNAMNNVWGSSVFNSVPFIFCKLQRFKYFMGPSFS